MPLIMCDMIKLLAVGFIAGAKMAAGVSAPV